jgi:hypothetical protein
MAGSAIAATSRSSVNANRASAVTANVHRTRDRGFIWASRRLDITSGTPGQAAAFIWASSRGAGPYG